VPGFVLSLLAVYLVSKMDKEPAESITKTFDAVGNSEI